MTNRSGLIARHPPPPSIPGPGRTYRVAGGVIMMVAAAIAFDWRWITGVMPTASWPA